ncbi:MAG: hypothetical protein ABSA34_03980 [Candidatus Goldiibacteriota bacterium]|jgi:hypothetical protein
MKKIFTVLALLMIPGGMLLAELGGIPFETLYKTIGARSLAMGETAVGNPSGITTILWNPAYLDSLMKNEVYAGAELLYGGASMEYLSYTTPIGKYGGLGFMAGYLGYGSYEETTVDSTGNQAVLGNSDYKDIFISAAYGKNIIAGIEAGISMKMLLECEGSETFPAFNADVSFFKSFELFDLGLAFKNILPLTINYDTDSEQFITTMRFGGVYKALDGKLKIAADIEKYFIKENPFFYFGAEYNISDLIFIRAGYNTFSEVSGGLGINFNNMGVDYTLTDGQAAVMHKIAVYYDFGGYDVAVKADPEVFSPVGSIKKTYLRVSAMTKYEIFKWLLEIKDKNGAVVKSWNGTGTPDAENVWDGLRQDGMPMDEGDYKAVLTVVDENDKTIKSTETLIRIKSTDAHSIPLFGE